jgi:vancomycin permeability regulator SanA
MNSHHPNDTVNETRQRARSNFWRGSVPRGLALFFGGFSIFNLVGDFRSPGFDANIWWIDLRLFPHVVAKGMLLFFSLCLVAFAVRPPVSKFRRIMTAACAGFIGILTLINSGQFFAELFKGDVKTDFPVPLSLFVSVAFIWIFIATARKPLEPRRQFIGVAFVFLLCAFVFPVLQLLCFGNTDYRRKADVAVVLGARAYADGRPSDALADRVRTACELYNEGLVAKLIFSGGPGDGNVHETEAMRRMAVSLGVKDEDILVDEAGLNTQATVENTLLLFKQLKAQRVLVVSHFYHLPRIKMTYRRAGWDVFTVPAEEAYFLRQTPYMVLRETAALWVYYLRPLS